MARPIADNPAFYGLLRRRRRPPALLVTVGRILLALALLAFVAPFLGACPPGGR